MHGRKRSEIERRIFTELRQAISAEAKRIRQTSMAVAEVDVLLAFAHLASARNYVRPVFDDTTDIREVVAGRHPVIETSEALSTGERFVPNDLFASTDSDSLLLITGPNMGGKSTYLRQSRAARAHGADRQLRPGQIGTAGDYRPHLHPHQPAIHLARGRSTFMVEMTETAAILNTASPRSWILLDEMGRRHRHPMMDWRLLGNH